MLQAYSHQELPFEKLVEELQPDRDPSRNPLFQVICSFQNFPHQQRDFHNLTVTRLPRRRTTATTDLDVFMWEESAQIRVTFAYNADLFEPGTVRRMLGHYVTILNSITTRPDIPVSRLPLLSDDERSRVLFEWNRTRSNYERNASICQLFESVASRMPNSIAAVCHENHLTYDALRKKANQIANLLRSLGVGSEMPVGLCVDRSLDAVVGMLGILKAGGAYVPLDSNYPKDRLRFMLADTGARVLLTQAALEDSLPEYDGMIVRIDADRDDIERQPQKEPCGGLGASSLAYIMYTSGSTGDPKGVMVEHRSISRLVRHSNYLRLSADDCVAQASNLSFDAATFEIWGPLLNGARIEIMPTELLWSPSDLKAKLQAQGITTMFLTTALFNQLVRQDPSMFSTLDTILFGGEASDPSTVRQIPTEGMPRRLLHVYGPTESTTFATYHEVRIEDCDNEYLPIGRPLSNTRCYVLDEALEPVPIGTPGELYLGGDGIARGYFRRPDLTRRGFLQNPFAEDQEDYLYRTGDRVKYLPNGNMVFLGRVDSQIKLRGHRIEPGEIEAVLKRTPGVADALVLADEAQPEEKRLLAYVQIREGATFDSISTRSELESSLPSYMIPTIVIPVNAWPLTTNGKVNREALPEPDGGPVWDQSAEQDTQNSFSTGAGGTKHRPKIAMTKRMIELWEEVLRTRGIQATDNFFDVGGHSLLAVELIYRIEEVFGSRLAIHVLFEAPTPEALSARLREQKPGVACWTLSPVNPDCTEPPLFLMWGLMIYRHLARCLGPEQPTYGIYLEAELDLHRDPVRFPFSSVEALARHYVNEIRSIRPHGPYQVGGVSFGGILAFEVARQLTAQDEQVTLLSMLDTTAPSLHRPSGWRSPFLRKLAPLGRLARHAASRAAIREYSTLKSQESTLPWRNQVRHLYRHYEPDPVSVPIVLFRATGADAKSPGRPSDLGWGSYTSAGVVVHPVEGSHAGILNMPNVELLAEKLKLYLTSL